jgi:hypothetical protein
MVREGGTAEPSGVVGEGTALERNGTDSGNRVGATSGRRNSFGAEVPIDAGATTGAEPLLLGVVGSEFDMQCDPSVVSVR